MRNEWQKTGDDKNDIVLNVGDYCLRVEKLGNKNFWWCAYYKEYEILSSNNGFPATTLEEGKLFAEIAFNSHKSTLIEIKRSV